MMSDPRKTPASEPVSGLEQPPDHRNHVIFASHGTQSLRLTAPLRTLQRCDHEVGSSQNTSKSMKSEPVKRKNMTRAAVQKRSDRPTSHEITLFLPLTAPIQALRTCVIMRSDPRKTPRKARFSCPLSVKTCLDHHVAHDTARKVDL